MLSGRNEFSNWFLLMQEVCFVMIGSEVNLLIIRKFWMFSKISTSVQENEVFENIVQKKVLCKFRNYNILFFFINIMEKKVIYITFWWLDRRNNFMEYFFFSGKFFAQRFLKYVTETFLSFRGLFRYSYMHLILILLCQILL